MKLFGIILLWQLFVLKNIIRYSSDWLSFEPCFLGTDLFYKGKAKEKQAQRFLRSPERSEPGGSGGYPPGKLDLLASLVDPGLACSVEIIYFRMMIVPQ
jgi:hypothetical protein